MNVRSIERLEEEFRETMLHGRLSIRGGAGVGLDCNWKSIDTRSM